MNTVLKTLSKHVLGVRLGAYFAITVIGATGHTIPIADFLMNFAKLSCGHS